MRPPRDPRDDSSRARAPDGKCDPAGRLWVGSKNLHCDKPTGALWSVDGSATWTRHVEGVGVSNGLVWTRDRKTFYYIDSPTRTIDAFDYDMKAGTMSNRRVAVRVKDGDGYPDGCAIDDEDKARVLPSPEPQRAAPRRPLGRGLHTRRAVIVRRRRRCGWPCGRAGASFVTTRRAAKR